MDSAITAVSSPGMLPREQAQPGAEGDQHKAEFGALRECEGEARCIRPIHAEEAGQAEMGGEFEQHENDKPADQQQGGRWQQSEKSMPAPTAMKKMASSRPLKGCRSISSSWRYSLSASTTPARKVPSAADNPTRPMSRVMPTTMQQGKGDEDFARAGVGDDAEEGPHEIAPRHQHQRHGTAMVSSACAQTG